MMKEFLRIMRFLWDSTGIFFRNLHLTGRRIAAGVGAAVVLLLVMFMLFTAGWTRPPINGVQTGYRGNGQVVIYNPRTVKKDFESAEFPEAPALADDTGVRASQVYQNIKVLGDLSVGQFTRTMLYMTQAVAPDQGCSYCHAQGNFASDELYTKNVARQMLRMTRRINTHWEKHVAKVGVACYTCHRGNNIPKQVWSNDPMVSGNEGTGPRGGPTELTGFASLPADALSALAQKDTDNIRVQGETALPTGNDKGIKDAESSFALMIYMANSLGVNCAFCHNTRSFSQVKYNPRGKRALYGLHMVQELNQDYVLPLTAIFPAYRKDASGEPYKIGCASCHQGVYRPLYGQKMLDDYPELNKIGKGDEGNAPIIKTPKTKVSAVSMAGKG